MKRLCWLISLLYSFSGYGQYYFNDIVSNQTSRAQHTLLVDQRIRQVKVSSYEPDQTPTPGFSLLETLSNNGATVTIQTIRNNEAPSVTIHRYSMGKIVLSETKKQSIRQQTNYTYNDKGQVSTLLLSTNDSTMQSSMVEKHEWSYDNTDQPVSMLRIKNGTDTLIVACIKDEQGNVIEEIWKRKAVVVQNYYYYYDSHNRLTDIVRYNTRLKKLMPDEIYIYDNAGRIQQMTQLSLGSNNYFVWKYIYNDNGLKQTEICFDKTQKQVARMEYQYE